MAMMNPITQRIGMREMDCMNVSDSAQHNGGIGMIWDA